VFITAEHSSLFCVCKTGMMLVVGRTGMLVVGRTGPHTGMMLVVGSDMLVVGYGIVLCFFLCVKKKMGT
jgi:hypothetical protein